MIGYINEKGLINANPPGRSETDENTLLFTNVYNFFCFEYHYKFNSSSSKFLDFMERDGWFKNVVPDVVPEDRKGDLYLSRDQMFSYSVASIKLGKDAHVKIWKKLLRYGFTYDNVSRKFNIKRIVRPRDWIFVGYLARNPICYLLMGYYYFCGLFTCLRYSEDNTSGVHLLLHNSIADNHILKRPAYWIYEKIVGDFKKVLMNYYKSGHPTYERMRKLPENTRII